MTGDVVIDPRLYSVACIIAVTLLVYLNIYYITVTVISLSVVHGIYICARPRASRDVTPEGKAILITGCDSGFGNELAKKAHEMGFTVFAGCLNDQAEGPRELEAMYEERMHVLSLDVTNENDISSALEYVRERSHHTGLWGLVNNAGVYTFGPIELSSMEVFQDVAKINLFGSTQITKAFLPLVRQAQGRIVNVSSERGRLARGLSCVYSVTKFGLEAFSDSLRHEMKRFGVKVSVIEPCSFAGATAVLNEQNIELMKSRLYESLETANEDVLVAYPKEDVDQMIQRRQVSIKSSSRSMDKVIDAMIHALVNVKPKTRYLISGAKGWFDPAFVLCHLKNILPESAIDYLIEHLF